MPNFLRTTEGELLLLRKPVTFPLLDRIEAAPLQLRVRRFDLRLGEVHRHHLLTGQSLLLQHAVRLAHAQPRLLHETVGLRNRLAYASKVRLRLTLVVVSHHAAGLLSTIHTQ